MKKYIEKYFKNTVSISKAKEIVFTPKMISTSYGLFIINTKGDVNTNPSYAATVSWKLTWTLETSYGPEVNDNGAKVFKFNKYTKTNFLTDGLAYSIGNTIEEVCDYLNNNEYGQHFRPMTKKEVLFLIKTRNQGFL